MVNRGLTAARQPRQSPVVKLGKHLSSRLNVVFEGCFIPAALTPDKISPGL